MVRHGARLEIDARARAARSDRCLAHVEMHVPAIAAEAVQPENLLAQDVEVIVNAWNRNIIPWWLLLPQGVSGAIKKKGGLRPFRELGACRELPSATPYKLLALLWSALLFPRTPQSPQPLIPARGKGELQKEHQMGILYIGFLGFSAICFISTYHVSA